MTEVCQDENSHLCANQIIIIDDYRLQIEYARSMCQKFEFSMKDVGIGVFVKANFYYEYNFFVEQYNEDINRINDKYMKKLKCLIFTTMPWCCCYPLWILFSIVVVFSVPTFIYNLFRFITLINIISTLKENKKNIPDPFQKMIYCKNLNMYNEYFRLTSKL